MGTWEEMCPSACSSTASSSSFRLPSWSWIFKQCSAKIRNRSGINGNWGARRGAFDDKKSLLKRGEKREDKKVREKTIFLSEYVLTHNKMTTEKLQERIHIFRIRNILSEYSKHVKQGVGVGGMMK